MTRLLCCLVVAFFLVSPSLAEIEPRTVVDDFYKSYLVESHKPGNWLKSLMEKNGNALEPALRDLLLKLSQGEPGGDEPWLDFDPFSNSQMGTESYSLGQTKMKGSLAYVPVLITYPFAPDKAHLAANAVLRKSGGTWKIANLAYPASDGMPAWDLLGYLKESFKLR